MSFSYSGNPASSDLDMCRFNVGDTDSQRPIMQDEEVLYLIQKNPINQNALLYQLFSHAATIYARDVKRSLGPQSEDPTERIKYFKDQAAMYKAKAASAGLSTPSYAYPKVFSKGMHNNPPWTGGDTDV